MSDENNIHAALVNKPVIAGVIATVTGWSTAFMAYIEQVSRILAFIGTFCGTVAAIYTMLIVVRRYHKGVNDDKRVDNERE